MKTSFGTMDEYLNSLPSEEHAKHRKGAKSVSLQIKRAIAKNRSKLTSKTSAKT